MRKSSKLFVDVVNAGKNVGEIVESLDSSIDSIVRSAFKKFKNISPVIDKDDVKQDIRLYLYENFTKIREEKNLSSEELYRYLSTLVKRKTRRILVEAIYTNPRIIGRRKAKAVFISLSAIDMDRLCYTTEYPLDNIINTLEERCKGINHASKVFTFLTSKDIKEKYAGLSRNTYYSTLRKMKQLLAEIVEEMCTTDVAQDPWVWNGDGFRVGYE